MVNWLNRRSRA